VKRCILPPRNTQMKANCPRCNATSFTWTSDSFNGVRAMLIYCSKCGCVVGVLPKS
jgi:transcription elongation factor Elf1